MSAFLIAYIGEAAKIDPPLALVAESSEQEPDTADYEARGVVDVANVHRLRLPDGRIIWGVWPDLAHCAEVRAALARGAWSTRPIMAMHGALLPQPDRPTWCPLRGAQEEFTTWRRRAMALRQQAKVWAQVEFATGEAEGGR